MTDQLPGRTPSWSTGVWISPAHPQPQAPPQPVRIGDAERDTALDKLADHFAAGRLTRDELDERTEKAMGARFDRDLELLFRDLPSGPRDAVAVRVRPRGPVLPAAVGLLLPLLALAVVASVLLHGGPVLIAPVVWLLLLSGRGRQHRHR